MTPKIMYYSTNPKGYELKVLAVMKNFFEFIFVRDKITSHVVQTSNSKNVLYHYLLDQRKLRWNREKFANFRVYKFLLLVFYKTVIFK